LFSLFGAKKADVILLKKQPQTEANNEEQRIELKLD
jgi:hypothetical protein